MVRSRKSRGREVLDVTGLAIRSREDGIKRRRGVRGIGERRERRLEGFGKCLRERKGTAFYLC